MNDEDPAKRLDELMRPGSTMMVGTEDGSAGLQFRPLTVARLTESRIDILLDSNEQWVSSFADGDAVHVTVEDTKANTWVELRGSGSTTTDPQLIDELWNPFAAAYFDQGRETPGISVMQLDIDDGRYWSTASGRIGSLISMVKAKLGSPEDAGEHGDVAV